MPDYPWLYLKMDFIRTDWIDEEMKNVFEEPEKNSAFTGENLALWNPLSQVWVTFFSETEFPSYQDEQTQSFHKNLLSETGPRASSVFSLLLFNSDERKGELLFS